MRTEAVKSVDENCLLFLCNVRADWLPIDGREAIGEPRATVSFTAEELKRQGLRGLYRVRQSAISNQQSAISS